LKFFKKSVSTKYLNSELITIGNSVVHGTR